MNDDDLPDDDPEVVAGMQRLAELRKLEADVADMRRPRVNLEPRDGA